MNYYYITHVAIPFLPQKQVFEFILQSRVNRKKMNKHGAENPEKNKCRNKN